MPYRFSLRPLRALASTVHLVALCASERETRFPFVILCGPSIADGFVYFVLKAFHKIKRSSNASTEQAPRPTEIAATLRVSQ